jgi:hypothetical protein
MASATELANQGLLKLGAKMISNIEAPVTAAGSICAELLQPSLDVFTTSYMWSWSDGMRILDYLVPPEGEELDPPLIDYEYRYNVPTDFLHLQRLKDEWNNDITDYALVGGPGVECNFDVVKFYYTRRIDPAFLPSPVIDAFTSYLAHRLSPAIDGGKRAQVMLQEYVQKATAAFLEDARQRKDPIDSEDYYSGR